MLIDKSNKPRDKLRRTIISQTKVIIMHCVTVGINTATQNVHPNPKANTNPNCNITPRQYNDEN